MNNDQIRSSDLWEFFFILGSICDFCNIFQWNYKYLVATSEEIIEFYFTGIFVQNFDIYQICLFVIIFGLKSEPFSAEPFFAPENWK